MILHKRQTLFQLTNEWRNPVVESSRWEHELFESVVVFDDGKTIPLISLIANIRSICRK